jgi:hypothetical protein
MALETRALEIGMGTDIRGGDYHQGRGAAQLRDALWHNSLTVAVGGRQSRATTCRSRC